MLHRKIECVRHNRIPLESIRDKTDYQGNENFYPRTPTSEVSCPLQEQEFGVTEFISSNAGHILLFAPAQINPSAKDGSRVPQKRTVLAIALMLGAVCANAQETTSTGDLYQGLTRKIAFERMIPPHGLEITYDKTVHIIFPSAVRYVDLGSPNLIAGKADGAENVIRVKATVKDFHEETNMSVITEDGAFYTFSAPIIGA